MQALRSLLGGGPASGSPEVDERLTPYAHSADYPPRDIGHDPAACEAWYRDVFGSVPPLEADPSATPREKELCRLSASEYVAMRKAGDVTCEEYATALVKRAKYYRYMNHWIYTSYDLFEKTVAAAVALDARVATDGVEAIAPLYGLCIPMKGTAAVVDFPAGSGVGILSGYVPTKDSDLTTLIKQRNGVIFGCTNVPEFAANWVTANPASGHTRNPYNHKFTVGGSSGGSASAVASYMCPIAVTEDTGGSTRVPASSNQNFGFDPSRNHYPNDGNPGMTFLCDQLGLNARSIADIILYDKALTAYADDPTQSSVAALHDSAAATAAARPASDIKVGAPLFPFVTPPGDRQINADQRLKLDAAIAAIEAGGFTVLREEWPSGGESVAGAETSNVISEALFPTYKVNGKRLHTSQYFSFGGQVATFVTDYLDAPVSLKEILADMGQSGATLHPAGSHDANATGDETQFRHVVGPKIARDVAAYNAYFDTMAVDLIIMPVATCATPDLASLGGGTVPVTKRDGTVVNEGAGGDVYDLHANQLKYLHIPKMVVPTGLTPGEGRPTAVQLWGRAVDYENMFNDAASVKNDIAFLYLVERVAAAVQAVDELKRMDASLPIVADLFSAGSHNEVGTAKL